MTDDPINQGGQGSAVERRLRHASGQCCVARGHAAIIAGVRSVRTSSIPIPGRSGASGPAGRSLRGYGTDYAQAPCGNSTAVTGVRAEQWADHRSDCDTRVGGVSEYSEKAWLSRAQRTALFKFTLIICLIACTTRSSPRLTVFLCPFGNVPSAAV
jgi:hypothetical protein